MENTYYFLTPCTGFNNEVIQWAASLPECGCPGKVSPTVSEEFLHIYMLVDEQTVIFWTRV